MSAQSPPLSDRGSRLKQRNLIFVPSKPARPRFIHPSVEEGSAYCQERGNHIAPQYFIDFCTTNGWKQGKGKPATDWTTCIPSWERKDNPGHETSPAPPRPKPRIERRIIDGEEVDVEGRDDQ